jgi:hypothetical protein
MRRHSFTALVMLDPAAGDRAARTAGTLAGCLVEPSRYMYFPAVISLDTAQPARTAVHVLVTIALSDSEVGAFFTPGQRFTIWADAVVGHTVRARGLVGYGVISRPVSPPPSLAPRDEAAWTAGRP